MSHVTREESLTTSPWDLRRKEAKKCLWRSKTLAINVKHVHPSLVWAFLRKSLWFIQHLCFYRTGYAAITFVLLRSTDTFISDWWNFIIIVEQKESPPGCRWKFGSKGVRKEQRKLDKSVVIQHWWRRPRCTDLFYVTKTWQLRGSEAKSQLYVWLLGAGLRSFLVVRDKTEVKHPILLLLLVNQQ